MGCDINLSERTWTAAGRAAGTEDMPRADRQGWLCTGAVKAVWASHPIQSRAQDTSPHFYFPPSFRACTQQSSFQTGTEQAGSPEQHKAPSPAGTAEPWLLRVSDMTEIFPGFGCSAHVNATSNLWAQPPGVIWKSHSGFWVFFLWFVCFPSRTWEENPPVEAFIRLAELFPAELPFVNVNHCHYSSLSDKHSLPLPHIPPTKKPN